MLTRQPPASLNPARSLGPAVVLDDFPGYFWIYWVGPGLGGALAAGVYLFFKHFRFNTANPGADFDDREAGNFVFDEENAYNEADVQRPSVLSSTDNEASRSRSPGSNKPATSPLA